MTLPGPCTLCPCGADRCITRDGRHKHSGAHLLCGPCDAAWRRAGMPWTADGKPAAERKPKSEWTNIRRARERRQEAVRLRGQGRSALSVALELGVHEDTVTLYERLNYALGDTSGRRPQRPRRKAGS